MTIPTGISHIDALLELIHSATHDAVAEYRKTGCGVPSPDDSSPHPLDSASDALVLKKAIRVLEGACERLCTTLAQPMHTVANRSMPYEAPCMRLVVERKIPDLLEGAPEGLHIESIAAKTSLDARKLRQVLRLLSTRGCFQEVAEDVFTNNRLSLTLLSSNPVSASVLLFTGECLKANNFIPEAFTDPEYGTSTAVNKTAFSYSVRGEMENLGLFDWYQVHDDTGYLSIPSYKPEVGQRFNTAMIGLSAIMGAPAVVNKFPWATMPQGTTLCDIGSGVGTVPLAIAKLWATELPEASDTGRVKFVPINFLQQAPVAGQDIYYMKHIIHDWPDSEAITILRNVANAMTSQSRCFIHDVALQHAYLGTNPINSTVIGLERAPTPLLPNYGTGNVRHYNLNINMVALFNSQERTCEEYAALGAEVGLKLVKAWDFAETYMLEFRLI
ncbi:hypothetical protein AAF712_013299 [Marasmius tenuissimus]|uniref:O-methyltransferase domain-containing protein n=1 Tax=Marasmius tenuissimus TaxID=585030 RepID=A0ABR2ZF21_9AGAR